MPYEVEYADEFEHWWDGLTAAEQTSVNEVIKVLANQGPHLGRPLVDTLKGSQFPNMKELRIQHQGRPYRVLFAFDPRRCALLLIGGDKTGNDRFYVEYVPWADAIYTQHLNELKQENKG